MEEAHSTAQTSSLFQMLAFLIPCSASAGSLLSGYISDKFFAGARSPIAAALYFLEMCFVILAALYAKTPGMAAFFLVALSFTANATHSILGTAAAMDIGGRKMTGFASGLIDSFQYFGATLGLWALGHLLDHYGWKAYLSLHASVRTHRIPADGFWSKCHRPRITAIRQAGEALTRDPKVAKQTAAPDVFDVDGGLVTCGLYPLCGIDYGN